MKKGPFAVAYALIILLWAGLLFLDRHGWASGIVIMFAAISAMFSLIVLIGLRYIFPEVLDNSMDFRDPLVLTAKEKWMEGILTETLCALVVISEFLFHGLDAETIAVSFLTVALLVAVFANLFPSFSPRRRKAGPLFSFVGITMPSALIILSAKFRISPDTAWEPAQIAWLLIVGAVLLAWLVSVPISYYKHVKIFQYPGEDAKPQKVD